MNNKGMTLVELLVTFSLAMVIIIGMFNLILDVKSDLDSKQTSSKFIEFSNIESHEIHMNLLKDKPIAVATRPIDKNGYWHCYYSGKYLSKQVCTDENCVDRECRVSGTRFKFSFDDATVNGETISVSADTGSTSIDDMCSHFYPCVIYAYFDPSDVADGSVEASFKVIAFNRDREKTDEFGNKYGLGIKYDKSFEKLPEQKYLNFLTSKPTISMSGNFLVLDYPLYETGDETNYGFRISYPFN